MLNSAGGVSPAQQRLQEAIGLDRSGQQLQAELLYSAVLAEDPENFEAVSRLSHFSMLRGDTARAIRLLQAVVDRQGSHPQLGVELAIAHLNGGQTQDGLAALEKTLGKDPSYGPAWLLLGEVRDLSGDAAGALKAWYQAVTRAQRTGQWRDEDSTPPTLLPFVIKAIERIRLGRRELFFGELDELRQLHGDAALARVERAVMGYLREWEATPSNPHQRPRFLYIPDLPNPGYYDPYLHPWATRLRAAFPAIRHEASALLSTKNALSDFVDVKEGDRITNYVGGSGPAPAWEAFFFYRHGQRFDSNHVLCPETSAVLDSIDLCRISKHAPEVCFSIMRPGTHILPHHGVTNSRLVLHLPLIIPPNCALNLFGIGEHSWKEGELMMFDDTFKHEAWNNSEQSRIILLMDCWNPYLTAVERQAIERFIGIAGELHLAGRSA